MRRKILQYSATFLVALTLVATESSTVWAHSGHDHDSTEPLTSLPDIVAKVNDVDIKKDAILSEFKAAVESYGSRGTPLTAEQEKASLKKLVDREIKRALVSQKAKDLSIQISPETVEKKLQAIKAKFDSDAIFEKKLSQKNMSLAQYKDEIKLELMLEQIMQKEMPSQIEVSPQEIKNYYDKNPELFNSEEKVQASVILIKVRPNAGEAEEKQAREKIEMVSNQIKSGSDFGDLAKRYSQDSLAPRGGDLGFLYKKQMQPAFSEKAFSMKPGEVSEIFKTNFGYHILKVTDKKPETHVTLEEAKERIKETLRGEKLEKQAKIYTETLRSKANIKTYF